MAYKDLAIRVNVDKNNIRRHRLVLIDKKEQCMLDKEVVMLPTNTKTEAAYRRWLSKQHQKFQYLCEGVNTDQPDHYIAVIGTDKNFRQYANRIRRKAATSKTNSWDDFVVTTKDMKVARFILTNKSNSTTIDIIPWTKILCLKHATKVGKWNEIHDALSKRIKEVRFHGQQTGNGKN